MFRWYTPSLDTFPPMRNLRRLFAFDSASTIQSPRSLSAGGLALGVLALGLAACGATPPRNDPAQGQAALVPSPSIEARGERIEIDMGPDFREIALLEDLRTLGEVVDGTPRLIWLMRDEDARVRARAARALGRLPYPRFGRPVTDALARALADPIEAVRLEAAFGLGQRRDPASSASLLAYLQDPSPRMRARVVEAAAKIEGEAAHRSLLAALLDENLSVRFEAADGMALWSREEESATDVDRALLNALIPKDETGLPLDLDGTAPDLRWRILHALGRRRAEMGRGVFLERLGSNAPLDRLFAAIGLGRIAPDPDPGTGLADAEATQALVDLLVGVDDRPQEPDWRVAVEACRALAALGDAVGLAGLERASGSKSVHVRVAAMGALGRSRAPEEDVRSILRRARLDLSRSVRAAALEATVLRANPEAGLELVRAAAASEDFVERGLAATSAGLIDTPASTELLLELTRDPEHFVATRAVEALGQQDLERVRPHLHELLRHPDNGLRLAAIMGLARGPVRDDAPPLIEAFRTSTGEISGEVAFNALRVLARAGGPLARATHLEALRDPRPHVRLVAGEGLEEVFGERQTVPDPGPLVRSGEVALPGRDYPRWTHNPMAEVLTTKGRMVFELLPTEAPVHVHSFLMLAQQGFYDGLFFHRVVPDFVVQGGDARGDGNGGRPVRGDFLRSEFSPRSFKRGSLGMPRNEDPDSGGSQIFITHRPTPHLDGRYTLFGLLRAGGEVLDSLELGDRIIRIRPLE